MDGSIKRINDYVIAHCAQNDVHVRLVRMCKKRNETKSVYVNTAHKNIFAQHKLTNRHASWTHSSHGQCCLINMSITPTVALGTHQVLLRTRGDTPKFNYFLQAGPPRGHLFDAETRHC